MAKTLDQLNQQIARLQEQVKAVKARESAEVVKRIKEAIAYYSLTPADLFGGDTAKPSRAKRASKPARPAASDAPASKAKKPRKTIKTRSAAKKASPARFADESGNTWSGKGRPPQWLVKAIAAGKTKDDFAVDRKGGTRRSLLDDLPPTSGPSPLVSPKASAAQL